MLLAYLTHMRLTEFSILHSLLVYRLLKYDLFPYYGILEIL